MSGPRDINADIHRLCARRSELWSQGDGESKVELDSIAAKLSALYEEKRTAAASQGTPKQRAKAIKRATVEKELDRLMQT